MFYYELSNEIIPKVDIDAKVLHMKLSRYINFSMNQTQFLRDLHNEQKIKLYCYDYLYPIERDGIYKKNRVYKFRLRTPVLEIANNFSKAFLMTQNDEFRIITSNKRKMQFRFVKQIYTITPAICTLGDRYWKRGERLSLIEEQIKSNLYSKYEELFDEEINKEINNEESFMSFISITNRKDIVMKFKQGNLIANKFDIGINEDEFAQKMAYLIVSTGLLEKNSSMGAGFCNYK